VEVKKVRPKEYNDGLCPYLVRSRALEVIHGEEKELGGGYIEY
jgi:hypothetical protein